MISHSRPLITEEDVTAVTGQLRTHQIGAGGSASEAFADELKAYLGVQTVRFVGSGRAALITLLRAYAIGPGDEVVMPTYVCRSVADAVMFVGAIPVLIDVDDFFCITPGNVRKAVTSRTRAVILVHLFGNTADVRGIAQITREKGIVLIEDIAQAIGGSVEGKKLGSWGDAAFGSLNATKLLTAGEGGFLALNNTEFCSEADLDPNTSGAKFSDLNASLGRSQLKQLDNFIDMRKQNARIYIEELFDGDAWDLPVTNPDTGIFFRFMLLVSPDMDFNELRRKCEEQGFQIRKGVDQILHELFPGFSCPNADRLFARAVSLPVYPGLELEDILHIARSIKQIL